MKLSKIQILTTKFKNIKMYKDESFSNFYVELSDIVNSFSIWEKIFKSKVVKSIPRYLTKKFVFK